MKRVFNSLLAVLLATALCSCKSQEEIELERANKAYEEAKERAEQAKKDYDDLVDTLKDYNELRDELNGN